MSSSETTDSPPSHGIAKPNFWRGFIITWVGFTLMYGARLGYVPGSQVIWAALASTGFLIAAWTRRADRDAFGVLVFLGLVGCWFGDVIGPFNFMTGVYAFFIAHAAFIVACWTKGIDWRRLGVAVLPMAAVSAIVLFVILPQTPDKEVVKIASYTVLISIMVVAAVGAGKSNTPLMLAAIIFFISDVFVAFWRFTDSTASGWICYPIYYSACLLFAYSVHVDKAMPTERVDSD